MKKMGFIYTLLILISCNTNKGEPIIEMEGSNEAVTPKDSLAINLNNEASNKVNLQTNKNHFLLNLNAQLGYTHDISYNAKNNFETNQKHYQETMDLINSYGDFDSAKPHLSERQIEMFYNEMDYMYEDHLEIGTIGCSWYCGGGPNKIESSSHLKAQNDLNYVPDNIHDFSLRTAWIEGKNGNGIGESVTYYFDRQSPLVTKLMIYNGYMKTEQTWKNNGRVKTFKLYINSKPYAILNLQDTIAEQIYDISQFSDTTGIQSLTFEILAVYKGEKYEDIAISELIFDGTGVHCFAAGTKVMVNNEESKPIEDLEIGDDILSYNNRTNQFEFDNILAISSVNHHNLYELIFEDIKIKVTDDHPFFYQGLYYSILPNQKYGIETHTLTIGQNISYYDKTNTLKSKKLTGLTKINSCQQTYTVSKLKQNTLFIANGLIVNTEQLHINY